MHYFGGKVRISKPLSQYLNSILLKDQCFVDMFCGACNIVSKIKANHRIANDIHKELIAMWVGLQDGRELPCEITKEQYYDIKQNGEDWLKGFVGFGCSYSGKWWGGYAKDNTGRNYCLNARNSTLKKFSNLKDVEFVNKSYEFVDVPDNSLIYCDIPYKNTTKYSIGDFDHDVFYEWAKQMIGKGHVILVSEYSCNVPEDASIVWCMDSKKDIRNKDGVQERTKEVLFTF